MSSAVANASPLIALARINRFSLLRHLFQDVVVPEAVWQEVVVHLNLSRSENLGV